jgi:hypothetical protein
MYRLRKREMKLIQNNLRKIKYLGIHLMKEVKVLFFIIHLFTYACIVWVISSSYPLPDPLPTFPLIPGRSCSAFITNFVEEKTQA